MSKAAALGQTAYTLYPLANYSFNTKNPKNEKDTSVAAVMARMKAKYEKEGPRRSVEGVLLVQQHNHPHVLLLQMGSSFFKLPGGRLRPGEDETEGMRRKLASNFAAGADHTAASWEVGECVAVYWRPNFDTVFYPYLPPHITRPKECKKVFIIPMPERCNLTVARNLKLLAVPLFELFDNAARYGPIIAALPSVLSRLRLNLVHEPTPLPTAPSAGDTQTENYEIDFDA